jgi:hypothetical protein
MRPRLVLHVPTVPDGAALAPDRSDLAGRQRCRFGRSDVRQGRTIPPTRCPISVLDADASWRDRPSLPGAFVCYVAFTLIVG